MHMYIYVAKTSSLIVLLSFSIAGVSTHLYPSTLAPLSSASSHKEILRKFVSEQRNIRMVYSFRHFSEVFVYFYQILFEVTLEKEEDKRVDNCIYANKCASIIEANILEENDHILLRKYGTNL